MSLKKKGTPAPIHIVKDSDLSKPVKESKETPKPKGK